MTTSRVTSIFSALMLICSGAHLVASQTPSPCSEVEHKTIQAHKRLRSDVAQKAQSSLQQASASESAQVETYSRRAQLKGLLYEILEELPLDLICIITTYDSHMLTGKLQCTLSTGTVSSTNVASIAALIRSPNDNIFYAQTSNGVTYWCNAATGEISSVEMQIKKNPKLRTDPFPEAPKLVRSHALLSQAIKFPDGTIAQSQGKDIIISTPGKNTQSTTICTFRASDLITTLLALGDGRLVTGLFNGQVNIWV